MNDKSLGADAAAVVSAGSIARDQRPHADVILRVARSIFEWRFPRVLWSDPLFEGERDDCMALAVQHREMFLQGVLIEPVYLWTIPCGHGISPQWRQSFVAGKVSEALSELAAGVEFKGLPAADRAWLRSQADQLVEDALARFAEPISTGHLYEPHREYDPSEVDFDGRTEDEAQR